MNMNRVQWNSHHGPAINVKDDALYSHDLPDDVAQAIWEDYARTFWDNAEERARDHGYAGVYQEGRSGGWCVPHYPNGWTPEALSDQGTTPDDYADEIERFERFGAEIVDLMDACVTAAEDGIREAEANRASKAALLELGTPVRWTR